MGIQIRISEFSILPNPSDGNFVLKFDGLPEKYYEIKIYDALGRVLISAKQEVENQKISLHTADGIYFLEAKAGHNIFRRKLIVEHMR